LCSLDHPDLHSFPTRRSSDLEAEVLHGMGDLAVLDGKRAVPRHPRDHGAEQMDPAGVPEPGDENAPAHSFDEILARPVARLHAQDRKSTRLNSSHDQISYAVF